MDTITLVHYNAKGYGGFYNSKICDQNKNKVFLQWRESKCIKVLLRLTKNVANQAKKFKRSRTFCEVLNFFEIL